MSTLVTPGRAFAAAAIVVASTLAGSVAHSYFLAPAGGGTGNGATAGFTPVSVTAEIDPNDAGLLLPGQLGDVVLTITNDNPFAVTVSVQRNGDLTSSDHEGCDGAEVLALDEGFDGLLSSALADPIPAQAAPVVVRLQGVARLAADAPGACQGATFTIPVTVTAEVTR